jgi:glycosyltransferase involved in cell wall biosynthesis
MGCNMSFRREVLSVVNGFDEGLGRTVDNGHGCEETELCIRAKHLRPEGYFIFEPEAVVHHWVPKVRSSWSYFSKRCRAEGISKARVASTVGRVAALSEEKKYTRRVLPSAFIRHLVDGLAGEVGGLARAAAIVTGLLITALSFFNAKATRLNNPSAPPIQREGDQPTTTCAPTLPLVIDLDEPLPSISACRGPDSVPYRDALCLVTLNGEPLQRVKIDISEGDLSAEQVAEHLWKQIGPRLTLHCHEIESAQGNLPAQGFSGKGASTLPEGVETADVDVVVATKDRPDMLQKCLSSILEGLVRPRRLIVVDNASSTSETAQVVEQMAQQEPGLVYVWEGRPGLGRAHNAGLPHVRSSIVAFTDDDVIVDSRWLERILLAFGNDESICCVTGMIAPLELETLPQQWVEANATYDKGLRRRIFDATSHRPLDPLFPYTSGVFGSGANMAFRTEYLRHRGGFDNALGAGTIAMGGDDLAAFYDVMRSGKQLVYEPAAIVLHRHHREYEALRRQIYGYGAGLGAHLTRCFLTSPRMSFVFLRYAGAVLHRGFEVMQPSIKNGLPPYPRELKRQQWKGLASGPGRFIRSRIRSIRMR